MKRFTRFLQSLSSRPERTLERSERARAVERPAVPKGYVAVAARILLATLREIFDEAAYARFLKRTGSESSAAGYAAFCRERDSQLCRKTRCC